MGGASSNEGKVVVNYSGLEGGVCGSGWSLSNANVVCRQLGYTIALSATTQSDSNTGWYWIQSAQCYGNETQLSDCQLTGFGVNDCPSGSVAVVTCNGMTTLLIN